MPRIQDWKSGQLQSLHMVTRYIANHNKGFETMTMPSSFDISRAGPGFVDLFAVRDWQRCWSTTLPWQTWICLAATLALKGLRLGVWSGCWGSWGIGHERTKRIKVEIAKWFRGRPYRGLVLRYAKSIIQIWVSLSLFFSFYWRPHNMWVSEEVWEECCRIVESVKTSCVWIDTISPRSLQIFFSFQALAERLKHNSALTNVNLSWNNIGPEGAQAWCLVRMVRILRNRSWGGEVLQ